MSFKRQYLRFLESSAPADYQNNLTQLADGGFTPIYAIGFLMTDALKEIAPQYPDTKFAIVDSVVKADNVASLTFREQEGSYLAGVVAGLMTQQKTDVHKPGQQGSRLPRWAGVGSNRQVRGWLQGRG